MMSSLEKIYDLQEHDYAFKLHNMELLMNPYSPDARRTDCFSLVAA